MALYWISTWAIGFLTLYLVDATATNIGVKVDMLFKGNIPAWQSVSWQRSLRAYIDGEESEDCSRKDSSAKEKANHPKKEN
ncbi:hypothetical protein N7520_005757 [Penicillium odoratum]|uniref:uncharacterized protein n=1 Tax=Penicillium odoratum TaxID=1167516 RepID=UPI002546B6F7|nr:uncharacterized protein N7520_005757 [Penicillium odoratum]KAJ5758601.1 hypothetical protein N7520_005757 [Penicillium odoratum]